ncbi:MAG: glycosyltransferase family 4 protein [Thermoflexales bacterium]|nr:glycosyltransferase family 4 protein [Thermoflexales bacterium]
MRLLNISHQYPPALGGAEKHLADMSEELVIRGHHVDVYTTRSTDYRSWANTLPRFEQRNGVGVHRFDAFQRREAGWKMMNQGYARYWQGRRGRDAAAIFLGSGPLSPGLFVETLRTARRYDVVHLNQLHYSHALTGYLAARASRTPIILTPHLHTEQPVTWDIGYLRRIILGCAAIIVNTRAERELVRTIGYTGPILIAGVGIDLQAYPARERRAARQALGLRESTFVVLALGRKADYKGLDVTLAAMRRLAQRHQDIALLAYGAETEASAALWAGPGNMSFVDRRGEISNEDKLNALAACDVMCMPSTGESFGITYVEAWAYARPVIGARIRAVSELIDDGKDGYLIPPGDDVALEARLEALLAAAETGRVLGEAGWKKLTRCYTRARVADVFESACAMARRRGANSR